MQKAQYGILRFAKYKGPEISDIEAHNERKKEKYASNCICALRRSQMRFRTAALRNITVGTGTLFHAVLDTSLNRK